MPANNNLKTSHSERVKRGLMKKKSSEEIVLCDVVVSEIQERLSQAEAERDELKAARLSNLMDVAEKLSHALGMVMKANHVDVRKPSEECLKEHFVILLPTEDDEEAKLALAEWDGIKKEGV